MTEEKLDPDTGFPMEAPEVIEQPAPEVIEQPAPEVIEQPAPEVIEQSIVAEQPAQEPEAFTMPILTRNEQEMAAGRAKVLEHEGREAMMAAKRSKEGVSESAQVEAAKAQNSDL